MELVKRTSLIALASIIAAIIALSCSSILGANKAYAVVAKPKITVVAKDNGQVIVSVNKVKKAKKYQYKITKDKKLKKKVFTKTTTKRSIKIKSLTPSKKYYVAVRARDSKGQWGKWSKTKAVTVKATKPTSSQTATPTDNDQEIGVHVHDYQPGGSYDLYEQERAKNRDEAAKYANLMIEYNKTHSWQNGTFDASTYLYYESMNKHYAEQAKYYKELRDAEYYCSICGEQKPLDSTSASE